jgi:hypothetical protein
MNLYRMSGDKVTLFCLFKQPPRRVIFLPVLSQLLKSPLGHYGLTILASLALTDPYHHPFTINIDEPQARGIADSQSRSIRHH